QFGPLTSAQRASLNWRVLNYDRPSYVDPFVASQLLRHVGVQILWEYRQSVLPCFFAQGVSMLIFPLGLVIAPPAGATPLTLLAGGGRLSLVAGAALGAAYGMLLAVVLWRLWNVVWLRQRPRHLFMLWPALALFVFSLPSEDPRFRLPIVPLMLMLALAIRTTSGSEGLPHACEGF